MKFRVSDLLIRGDRVTFRFAPAGIITGTIPLSNYERLELWKEKKRLLKESSGHRSG